MGVIHTSVTIRNLAQPDREWDGVFLVDTGASDTMVPRPHLEAIGLEPRGQRTYELADGAQVTMDITSCEMELMGEKFGALVVYGEAGTEPLLGVIALEAAGIRIDLRNQTLHKMPSFRL